MLLCNRLLVLFACIFSFHLSVAQHKYDVVVYGATPGGITAALQVAQMGKKVILIEPLQHIGGHITEGLGSADIDNHKEFRNSTAIGGMALEFYRKLAAHYNRTAAFEQMLKESKANTALWKCESSVAEKIFEDRLQEKKVQVVKGSPLAEGQSILYSKGKIRQLTLQNKHTYEALVFIDASYEGDLLALAGISFTVGRESNATYNETLNGIRAETKHAQFAVKVDPYQQPGNPSSGLIPTVLDEAFGIPGGADSSLQAYCFRVCLTNDRTNQITFSQPEGYNRNEYEIYIRYLSAGGKLYTPRVNLPNNKTDLGAWHDLSHNLYGMNRGYPKGSYAQREDILNYHARFTKGLFYFLANDTAVSRLAPALQQEWQKWGYAKDEFTDNNGFPRKFYVRDARRMVSDYVITEKTVSRNSTETIDDPIAVAYWPMDVHSVRRIVKNGFAYNEGFVFAGNTWKPFGISYRALIPKKSECTNLLTPTCISASHIAYGAVRLEHNFMDMGQVCGIAAVMAIESRTTVQEVNYRKLITTVQEAGIVTDAAAVGFVPE